MVTYEIKNYLKLICLHVDHFESSIVDEVNTNSYQDLEMFVEKYKPEKGCKVIIIRMNDIDSITMF